jgi:hypothetical protein
MLALKRIHSYGRLLPLTFKVEEPSPPTSIFWTASKGPRDFRSNGICSGNYQIYGSSLAAFSRDTSAKLTVEA